VSGEQNNYLNQSKKNFGLHYKGKSTLQFDSSSSDSGNERNVRKSANVYPNDFRSLTRGNSSKCEYSNSIVSPKPCVTYRGFLGAQGTEVPQNHSLTGGHLKKKVPDHISSQAVSTLFQRSKRFIY
jgi:hypothetical protein